jgi:hypothetical protein
MVENSFSNLPLNESKQRHLQDPISKIPPFLQFNGKQEKRVVVVVVVVVIDITLFRVVLVVDATVEFVDLQYPQS